MVFFSVFLLFSPQKIEIKELSVDGKTFVVEIADTSYLQMKGLSGHKPLAENQGMFFVFPDQSIHSFWMKDMLFPLDIIWISQDLKISHIEKNLSPETYPTAYGTSTLSQYVLEISAGLTEKYNIKIGDSIIFVKE